MITAQFVCFLFDKNLNSHVYLAYVFDSRAEQSKQSNKKKIDSDIGRSSNILCAF